MPRDGSRTRERILDAAQRLVIDHGFAATSVESVISASGSSKGAFFHHFASKRDLADALVAEYVAADLAMLDGAMAAARAASDDPAERVIAFLRHFEEMGDEIMAGATGCLYASVLGDLGLVEAGASEPITTAVTRWRDDFVSLLEPALTSRTGLEDVDVAALSDHVFVTFEGAFLLARSTADPSHMRRQLATTRRLVEALLG